MQKSVKLPDGRHITLKCSDDNIAGVIIIETFLRCVPFFTKNPKDNIFERNYWKRILERFLGSRNALYIMEKIYDNIVTPIEKDILDTRGYPSKIDEVLNFMCKETAKGRTDDWNDLNFMRMRNSEIIVAQMQKQVAAAYSEYQGKVLRGDKNAEIFVNPIKVLSEITRSQNVQTLENINPIEELSMMTKITPIGIGGVKNEEAWPKSAKNIHPSYYGNIDAIDSPPGPKIGTINYLTIGAAVNNNRGLFTIRDPKNVDPEETLSVGCSLVPFVNYNESARVNMAVGQSRQAIPLKDPEPPMVQTGYETILANYLSDFFIRKSPVDGLITDISNNVVTIKDSSGKLHGIDITPVTLRSGQGKFGLSTFRPIVSQGQRVKEGQYIAEGAHIKDGVISTGRNLLAAFMPWYGYNFEDGMVISESTAKRFTSEHMVIESVHLKPDEDVDYIINPGDETKKGSIIITYSTTLYDTETLKNIRTEAGIVDSIEIYSNIPENEMPEKLLPVYNLYKKKYEKIHKSKYPNGSFKINKEVFEGIFIKVFVKQYLTTVLGDKLNNRAFNKGIVSCCDTRTYIFTDHGWKLFKDLTDDDKVAYIKDLDTMKAGFVKPDKILEYDYNGPMYGNNFKYGVDYLMTPNHRMFFKDKSDNQYKIEDADKLSKYKRINFLTTGEFEFDDDPIDTVIIERQVKSYMKEVMTFNKKDFYELVGWVITEGSAYNNKNNSNKVIITQTKEPYVTEIMDLLTRMGFTYSRSPNDSNFIMCGASIYEYFSQFGKCTEKFIPEWMFHTSKENLTILFKTMIKGDGSFRDNDHFGFYSTSLKLMEGFVRLATLLGYRMGRVRLETQNRATPKYVVYGTWKTISSELNIPLKHNYIKEDYNDKVYCVTVPNNLIFVKRDGFAFWTGNSIVPDNEMPYIKELDKHLDIVYSTLSVVNRTNPGQLFEMATGLISKRLAELCTVKRREDFTNIFTKVLTELDNTQNKIYSKSLISKIKSLTDRDYTTQIVGKARESGFIPILVPQFKSPKKENLLKALNILGLKPKYKTILPDGRVTKEVSVGYLYVNKLEHMAEKKIQSRSTGGYSAFTLEPIAQGEKGKATKGGEYDIYSLLSYQAEIVIDELLGVMSNDHKAKNEMLAEIINTGKGTFKPSTSSPSKEIFEQLLLCMHLEWI